ncbi:unnamed protein product [Pedinophyceae sp. YPF-701]|nr:unnamed protein product [Pedinophyceae sp. YPF-701]
MRSSTSHLAGARTGGWGSTEQYDARKSMLVRDRAREHDSPAAQRSGPTPAVVQGGAKAGRRDAPSKSGVSWVDKLQQGPDPQHRGPAATRTGAKPSPQAAPPRSAGSGTSPPLSTAATLEGDELHAAVAARIAARIAHKGGAASSSSADGTAPFRRPTAATDHHLPVIASGVRYDTSDDASDATTSAPRQQQQPPPPHLSRKSSRISVHFGSGAEIALPPQPSIDAVLARPASRLARSSATAAAVEPNAFLLEGPRSPRSRPRSRQASERGPAVGSGVSSPAVGRRRHARSSIEVGPGVQLPPLMTTQRSDGEPLRGHRASATGAAGLRNKLLSDAARAGGVLRKSDMERGARSSLVEFFKKIGGGNRRKSRTAAGDAEDSASTPGRREKPTPPADIVVERAQAEYLPPARSSPRTTTPNDRSHRGAKAPAAYAPQRPPAIQLRKSVGVDPARERTSGVAEPSSGGAEGEVFQRSRTIAGAVTEGPEVALGEGMGRYRERGAHFLVGSRARVLLADLQGLSKVWTGAVRTTASSDGSVLRTDVIKIGTGADATTGMVHQDVLRNAIAALAGKAGKSGRAAHAGDTVTLADLLGAAYPEATPVELSLLVAEAVTNCAAGGQSRLGLEPAEFTALSKLLVQMETLNGRPGGGIPVPMMSALIAELSGDHADNISITEQRLGAIAQRNTGAGGTLDMRAVTQWWKYVNAHVQSPIQLETVVELVAPNSQLWRRCTGPVAAAMPAPKHLAKRGSVIRTLSVTQLEA